MLDGILGLIILIAMIRGAVKGIGDTLLRILGIAGGLALSVFYSGKVAEYISGTSIRDILHNNIYYLLMPDEIGAGLQAADPSASTVVDTVKPIAEDPLTEALPKTLGGLVSGLAEKTVSAAADRLTQVAISILAVVVIMLAVWLIMFIFRLVYKHFRTESFLLGFVDRLMGVVLGLVRGIILACIFVAALIPLTTIFAPDKVPEILEAMNSTRFAGIIYDINPLMLLIKYVIG